MNISRFKIISYVIFIVAVSSIISCSPRMKELRETDATRKSSVPQLTNIDITDMHDSTQVILETEGAINYTSFTLSDPPRIVIDLSEVSAGKYKEPIIVNKGAVKEIYPLEAQIPSKVTRLDIRLANDSKGYKMFRRDNSLIIEIPKPAVDASLIKAIPFPEKEEIAVAQQPGKVLPEKAKKIQEPEEKKIDVEKLKTEKLAEAKPAPKEMPEPEKKEELNVLRDIKVVSSGDQGEQTDIIINSDRAMEVETFSLGRRRIVIDVSNAILGIAKDEISIEDNRLISKLRIGRHVTPVRKIRIVADLKEDVTYKVNKGDKAVTLSILSKVVSKPSVETASKVVAAPKKETAPEEPLKYSGKKVSLDFQDADIINVLRLLAEVSKLNMIIGDSVTGKVTIKMLNVPWDQALDVILKMKGLGKVFEDNVLRVDTLANIAQQQEEEAKAKEATIKAENLITKIVPVNYAKASEMAEAIKKSLSGRGDLTIDTRTNTLIIKDIPDKHDEIGKLIKTLDKPTPQVLIEARIVQADSNFARDLGIQWGGNYATSPGDYAIGMITGPGGNCCAPTTGFAVNLPASGIAGPKGSAGFTIGKAVGDAFNLDLRLSAGETQGLTKVLSAPKIATLDNREATIQQGESIPYKTVSQTGTNTEFIDATLTLKVIPKVTPDGHIAMNIKITKNRQGSIVVEGTPSINKKEATTEVLVKDGETTVIGGIYEITDVDNESGIPWFHRIPVLGWLFKSTQKSNIKSELLIFITPKIIPVAA